MCRLNIFSESTLFSSLDPMSGPVCFFSEDGGFGTGRGLLDGIDFDDVDRDDKADNADASSTGKSRLVDKIF
ncbi:MAG: hypothetical protein CVV64_15935 [Candidatus Wallbacteria bacterium HGW-Wallbacteria-1]|uniref:Uncharacterized protein n=1 Tax=Candidatus Wallbacteria bacterium HGW-Wallbacteria-1 TaxID=2013854 RepID=A0A2N1PLB0_9BACT|nr:MAG: hypothetical protein CVV64_15935 [Candidatus Wallbacteria bacterium HGW-Wallbacteria-1]